MPFAVQPVKECVLLAFLAIRIDGEAAVGDVVTDAVAGDVLQGVGLGHVAALLADDDAQLDLPIDVIGRHLGNADRIAGVGERGGRRLPEEVGEGFLAFGGLSAALDDVIAVVAGQQDDLARLRDRRQQLDRLDGDAQFAAILPELFGGALAQVGYRGGGFSVRRQKIEQVGRLRQIDLEGFGEAVEVDQMVVEVEADAGGGALDVAAEAKRRLVAGWFVGGELTESDAGSGGGGGLFKEAAARDASHDEALGLRRFTVS